MKFHLNFIFVYFEQAKVFHIFSRFKNIFSPLIVENFVDYVENLDKYEFFSWVKKFLMWKTLSFFMSIPFLKFFHFPHFAQFDILCKQKTLFVKKRSCLR